MDTSAVLAVATAWIPLAISVWFYFRFVREKPRYYFEYFLNSLSAKDAALIEQLADEINALTADGDAGDIGDIILEDDGMGGYTVIADYREQVIELL